MTTLLEYAESRAQYYASRHATSETQQVADLIRQLCKALDQSQRDAEALFCWAIGEGRPSDDEIAEIENRLGHFDEEKRKV